MSAPFALFLGLRELSNGAISDVAVLLGEERKLCSLTRLGPTIGAYWPPPGEVSLGLWGSDGLCDFISLAGDGSTVPGCMLKPRRASPSIQLVYSCYNIHQAYAPFTWDIGAVMLGDDKPPEIRPRGGRRHRNL